ncbi:MAG TPA: hypothetical protein VKW06_11840 [Candidatus Angelobacter sp.]|nr:hypothetical protein [Candidatus Angelobacter sp.]
MLFAPRSSAARLHALIKELQFTNQSLRTDAAVDPAQLIELRTELDNLRTAAWTVSELHNARETRRDAGAVMSFLTSERIRRFRQMIDDFCSDLEHDGYSWPEASMHNLQESVSQLRERLGLLTFRRYSHHASGESK